MQLYSQGKSYVEIARLTGIDRKTASSIVKGITEFSKHKEDIEDLTTIKM